METTSGSEYTASTAATDTSATSQSTQESSESQAPLPPTTPGQAQLKQTQSAQRSQKTAAARSKATTSASRRASRLRKAKEELLKLQIEFAAARIAAIEAESDSEEDLDTVMEDPEHEQRIDSWMEDNRSHLLAISNEPHNREAVLTPPPPPPQPPPHIIECGNTAEALTQPPPTEEHRRTEAPPIPAGDRKTGCQIDLTELATAIAQAARAGQRNTKMFNELPYFDGAYQDWLSFRAAYFESQANFSDVENLARLRRCLKGRGKEAVESLLIYSSSPRDVIRTLENRFGRPDAIAITELEKIRGLPRLTDAPRDLCTFASKISNVVATLGAINKRQYLYNPEIVKNTIDKLTPTLKYRWYDFAATRPTEEPEIQKLSRFLTKEADLCSPYAQPEGARETIRRTQKTFKTQEKSFRSPGPPKCLVCDRSGHSATSCEELKKADAQRRWDVAKEKKLCFRCLRYRNRTHSCRAEICKVDGCERRHHPMLHISKVETSEVVSSTWTPKKSQAYLKILPVQVIGPRRKIDTYALLDDGSTVTLIDDELAQQAGLRGPREALHIEGIGETLVDTSASRRVKMTISGAGRRHSIAARSIKDLKLSPQTIDKEDLIECRHIDDIISRVNYTEARPRVLIGQDNWPLLLAEERRIGNKSQPIASLTPLGWVLHGAHSRTTGHRVHFIQQPEAAPETIEAQLKHFFSLESLTIAAKMPRNSPEVKALEILEEKTTRCRDGRFQTALLWKNENVKLPDNKQYALKRLEATERKISRDPDMKKKVIEQMAALLQKGYAEPAPENRREERTWYLPCFPVLNPLKPGKVRMVHDAAAITKGVSLNDTLLTGPDLLQSLPGTLMRLRQHRIAVSADIAEMFLQIRINTEDRDALRYLWRDCDTSREPKEYRMTSLIFGATSSPATAIYVKNRNAEDFAHQYPVAARAIKVNHYMDDYIQSFEDEETAVETARQVRHVHKQAHFDLRKWSSNSPKVLAELGVEDGASEQSNLPVGANEEKVLGMVWRTSSDVLGYNLSFPRVSGDALQRRPTKRQALQIVMSLFDPLGLVSPITMRAKQILQNVWKKSAGWDEHLDDELAEEWTKWLGHLEGLKHLTIPRAYLCYSSGRNLQLHVFVDASEVAYAAALYWRVEDEHGEVHTTLILAKARVAPLKTTSIPRLELQAAVMGSRMANCVVEEHERKPETRTFWTDSRTVLTWLRNGSRTYKPFVAHRIAELEENSKTQEWRWVPTKLNVADDSTRDVPRQFDGEHRWFTGPSFLKDAPDSWPQERDSPKITTGEERTMKISEKPSLTTAVPDHDRFSKWERYLRATARVLQFAQLCKRKIEKVTYARTRANKSRDPTWGKKKEEKLNKKIEKRENEKDTYLKLSAELLIQAENLIIRVIQGDCFTEEIHDLARDRRVSSNSKLRKIAVDLVNGVIVIKSRIDAAHDVPEPAKRPPVLDGRHHICRMYLEHVHRVGHHQGVEATINQCRQKFHILGIRPTARNIIQRCLSCRRRRWAPPEPPTGNHPAGRLAHHQRPFTCTGVDYFGPLLTTFGRGTRKTYVALFTCLTTRAVHLEMTNSLTTDSAVMALRRFIARRGCPREIWSDNGTNLHGAEKILRDAAEEATEVEAVRRKIAWRFIPPGAPFMGGAWERMVKSVKNALGAVLTSQTPSEEVLATLLAEVEMTVNSRPLTHVSVDPEDPEALTPNHFILLGPAHDPPPGGTTSSDLQGKSQWRRAQKLADMYWARWLREYMPELQHRREPHGRGPPLQVGDIVVIVDNTLPRNTWPLGRVTAVYPGPDGVVRAADVQTKAGFLRRPTKKLVILHTETPQSSVLPAARCVEPASRRTAGECDERPASDETNV